MITEAQRRALFALREALHLCDAADLIIHAHAKRVRVASEDPDNRFGILSRRAWLAGTDIGTILAEHPES